MLDTFLVEKTTVTAKGDGPVVDISAAESLCFLLTLEITAAVEQESLELSVFGGADENSMGKNALAVLPQQFYPGQYPFLINLDGTQGLKALRAHWEVNRWGRGPETPLFEFSLRLREVPPEIRQT